LIDAAPLHAPRGAGRAPEPSCPNRDTAHDAGPINAANLKRELIKGLEFNKIRKLSLLLVPAHPKNEGQRRLPALHPVAVHWTLAASRGSGERRKSVGLLGQVLPSEPPGFIALFIQEADKIMPSRL
jgi:hypothetical protein